MLYKTAFVGYVFSLLILGLFLLCSDVTGATKEGLIAHWPLDGDAKDASRNGHDGVIQGAKWVDGHTGKAAEFDGDKGWMNGSRKKTLEVSPMSCMFWMRPGMIWAQKIQDLILFATLRDQCSHLIKNRVKVSLQAPKIRFAVG